MEPTESHRRLRISAVIPTLNEGDHIVDCIERLKRGGVAEVVVVDGGSGDPTRERAMSVADRVLEVEGGLFTQLNQGARASTGDVLLFHYADGLLSERGIERIQGVLEDTRVLGGAFRLGFRSNRSVYRLIAFGASLRNRLSFGPFGDQSIFVRAGTFHDSGGFDSAVYFADYELVRSLRKSGRFRILGEPVLTSVRRWEQNGILRTLLSHWKLSAAYFLGGKRASDPHGRELDLMRRIR